MVVLGAFQTLKSYAPLPPTMLSHNLRNRFSVPFRVGCWGPVSFHEWHSCICRNASEAPCTSNIKGQAPSCVCECGANKHCRAHAIASASSSYHLIASSTSRGRQRSLCEGTPTWPKNLGVRWASVLRACRSQQANDWWKGQGLGL
eukprot:364825-Chlamydomonas_euryale.AAC.10